MRSPSACPSCVHGLVLCRCLQCCWSTPVLHSSRTAFIAYFDRLVSYSSIASTCRDDLGQDLAKRMAHKDRIEAASREELRERIRSALLQAPVSPHASSSCLQVRVRCLLLTCSAPALERTASYLVVATWSARGYARQLARQLSLFSRRPDQARRLHRLPTRAPAARAAATTPAAARSRCQIIRHWKASERDQACADRAGRCSCIRSFCL